MNLISKLDLSLLSFILVITNLSLTASAQDHHRPDALGFGLSLFILSPLFLVILALTKFLIQSMILWSIPKKNQGKIPIFLTAFIMTFTSTALGFLTVYFAFTNTLISLIFLTSFFLTDALIAYLVLDIRGKKILWIILGTLLSLITFFFLAILLLKNAHHIFAMIGGDNMDYILRMLIHLLAIIRS